MKRKLKKRITAFLLCMVLVVCNSVSILADEPVATAVESAETKEQEKATKEEKAPEATTAAKEKTTEKAPETTTAKKEETTTEKAPEATTAKKEEKTTEKAPETTTAKKEETKTEKAPEATTAKKEETTTEKAPETTTEKTDNTEASTATEKETAPRELIYENDQVTVKVSAISEGAIPAGATLKVVPIEKENSQTKTEYQEVEKKIQEKATQEKYDIAGFLAYDITLIDKDGKEVEPNSEVKVTMDYKQAAIPAETDIAEDEKVDVTVLHLEEDEAGNVKKVVDMDKAGKIDSLQTTDSHKIEKVEMKTSSFSCYTISWLYNWEKKVEVHYVDEQGQSLDELVTGGEVNESTGDTGVVLKDSRYNVIISGYTWKRSTVASEPQSAADARRIYKVRCRNESDGIISSYKVSYTTNDPAKAGEDQWEEMSAGQKIYMVYAKDTSTPGSSSSGESGINQLAHRKYVEANEDGTYDLTLNVIGATATKENPAKADVVFVLDLSGSMDDMGENDIKINEATTAAQTLVNNLENKGTVNAAWKLVTFSGGAKVPTADWINSQAMKSIINTYDVSDCGGGTNYEAALNKAGEVLRRGREGATKIVVFLTDGEPTYHVNDNGQDERGGGNKTNQKDYQGALDGAAAITCDQFYAIGMELPNYIGHFDGQNMSGLTLLEKMAGKIQGEPYTYCANVTSGLSDVFGNIAGQIVRLSASNVTITDQLSNEVDPVLPAEGTGGKPDLTVSITNAEGQDVTASEQSAANMQASYDTNTKEVRLDFKDDYELKQGYTYSVTLKIKPNEQAKAKYIENDYQYPHTGESDTGETSAGRKGIYSNGTAKVTWTTNGQQKESPYNKPVVQIPEKDIPVKQKKEPVNFYLNLSSAIMDTNGQITTQGKERFTRCVSGPRSETSGETGTGVPINKDLKVVVPTDHRHPSNGVYGVIGGETNQNARQVDEKIRELKQGTTGNVSGTENERYQIVNGQEEGAFPTDEEIFQYIQANWNKGDYPVNKGQDITVNGKPINVNKLTTENFVIRWYVFKDQSDDFWHIDGILVPKSGILKIQKTFPSQEVADSVKDTFKISTTGDFLAGTETDPDPDTTIESTLSQAKAIEKNNSDGSVTYTWSLAVFGDQYKIKEEGYRLADTAKWQYVNTTWEYTDADGQKTNGSTISQTVNTQGTANDDTPKTQTFAFTNNYEQIVDLDLIKISKGGNGTQEISGAEFTLSKQENGGFAVQGNPITVNQNGGIELSGLTNGLYALQETKAPEAHSLLADTIYFKVENGTIALCDANGNSVSDPQDMWDLKTENNGKTFVLTIKNNILYSLPSTGGNGIYWYTIGGMALMMGAALILYKDKRKRMVLLKR